MRYLMKEKLFSLGRKFIVKDESGEDAFIVEGAVLPLFGDCLSFRDAEGKELASIKEGAFSRSQFHVRDGVLVGSHVFCEIYKEDKLWAAVRIQNLTFTYCRFFIDVPGPQDLEASGDFFRHTYRFTQDGLEVARVSKEWFTLSDSYGVECFKKEDHVLILASTVAIDLLRHQSR
jgi:uncharacterized protein YxjI